MIKTYKYKLDPNRAQKYATARTLDICRELYNDALYQRKLQKISNYSQQKQLTELKKSFPLYKNVYSQALIHVLDKLDQTFTNFFKSGYGYPRFKSEKRFDSFCYKHQGFKLVGKYLQLSKIGNVKVFLSRELPKDSKIKICTIKRTVHGWFATLVIEFEPEKLQPSNEVVGVDVGIENFAALSDGSFIKNPKFYENNEAALRKASRKVSRRKKGSNRRRKSTILLAKTHAKITNKRLDFLHKETTKLVRKYGTIVIENLNIQGLAQGILSKQVYDASWSKFFQLLRYKAEEAGREVIEVDCKYTSQTCPNCNNVKKKKLSERQHKCDCGYTTHRDTAAAQVILGRADPSGVNVVVLNTSVA